jgi:hypothetical protein
MERSKGEGEDGVSTGEEWGEVAGAGRRKGDQGTTTGNSESEVAHGERGAHPRQDEMGRV